MTRNYLLAVALSLAIALGGLLTLSGGSVQAASFDGAGFSAAPVTDAEACSTHGSYFPGAYTGGDVVYVTQIVPGTVMPVPYLNPYYGYPFGYPFYGPLVTTTTITLPGNPYLPYYGEAYTTPTQVNYACNAFSNCQPVANAEAVVCPGNPAGIALNTSLTSATCGSATNIDAKVVGPSGLIVADGTPVLFSTTLGMVPGETSTDDGIASVSLVFPPKTTGTATLTVTSGTAKTEAKINVTC